MELDDLRKATDIPLGHKVRIVSALRSSLCNYCTQPGPLLLPGGCLALDENTQHCSEKLWETSDDLRSSFLSGSLALALHQGQSAHSIIARLDTKDDNTLPIILDKVQNEIERWEGLAISYSPEHHENFLSQAMTDTFMNQLAIMRSASKSPEYPTDECRDMLASIATALIPMFTQAHAPNAVVAQLSEELRNSPLNLIVLAMGATFQGL